MHEKINLSLIVFMVAVLVGVDGLKTLKRWQSQTEQARQSLKDESGGVREESEGGDECQFAVPERYIPPGDLRIRKGTVFVSVPSYRDDECQRTIYDLFSKARYPDRIFVGIVHQNKKGEDAESCLFSCSTCRERLQAGFIRVKNFSFKEAKGPCFARYEASKLWRGEQWYLQIDSHSKFETDWDVTMLEQIESTGDPKAIMSGYPPTEEQMKTFKKENFSSMIKMCKGSFRNGTPVLGAAIVKAPKSPPKIMFAGAGCMLMPYTALFEVPFDPFNSFLFMGEELLHSARLWCKGFNFYGFTVAFLTHSYGRKDKPKFWDDNEHFKKCQAKAVLRMKYFFGQVTLEQVPPSYRHDVDFYKIGGERSLEAYLSEAGIDFASSKFKNMC